MCGERAATILRTASEQAAQLKQQIQALGQTFDLTLVHSLHLDTAIAELRIAAWWSWLKPAFWNARSQYRQIARGLTKDSLAMANDLELLRNHTASCRAFAANAEVAAACGHEFRGLDSDFATLERTASWAGVVRQKLQGRTALEQRLRTFLLEGASTDLQVFANEWDSNASAFGVATQAEQSCRDRKAEEIAADKDAAAEAADRLANWASQLRLPDSSDGATLLQWGKVAKSLRELWAQIEAHPAGRDLVAPPIGNAAEALDRGRELLDFARRVEALGLAAEHTQIVYHAAADERLSSLRREAATFLERHREAATARSRAINAGIPADALEQKHGQGAALLRHLKTAIDGHARLAPWCEYLSARSDVASERAEPIVNCLESETGSVAELPRAFDVVLYRSLSAALYKENPDLSSFAGVKHEEARARFQQLDRELLNLNRQSLAADLCRRSAPSGNARGKAAEFTNLALITREIGKQKRHVPIRGLLNRSGGAILALTPCLMMSPLSVAQFITSNQLTFDLLVIDEASQMRPEDALGAVARAKNVVVVGDPMQLPPTSFFQAWEAEEDEDDETETVQGESILDLALGAFHPARDLRWHYRSKHEDLIRSSNRHFYEDRLLVFPSPTDSSANLGVELNYVEGTYNANTNAIEGQAIVKAVAHIANRFPDQSLGVVAMNQKQRDLISELIDDEAAPPAR